MYTRKAISKHEQDGLMPLHGFIAHGVPTSRVKQSMTGVESRLPRKEKNYWQYLPVACSTLSLGWHALRLLVVPAANICVVK